MPRSMLNHSNITAFNKGMTNDFLVFLDDGMELANKTAKLDKKKLSNKKSLPTSATAYIIKNTLSNNYCACLKIAKSHFFE